MLELQFARSLGKMTKPTIVERSKFHGSRIKNSGEELYLKNEEVVSIVVDPELVMCQ